MRKSSNSFPSNRSNNASAWGDDNTGLSNVYPSIETLGHDVWINASIDLKYDILSFVTSLIAINCTSFPLSSNLFLTDSSFFVSNWPSFNPNIKPNFSACKINISNNTYVDLKNNNGKLEFKIRQIND